MRKKTIITLGGATEDINIYPSEAIVINNSKDILRQKLLAFEYGAKISIDTSVATFGGGAANAAVNFANLGFESSFLGVLGTDERAKRILNNFKTHKVNTSLVKKCLKIGTPFSIIVIGPKKEHVAFVYRGCKDKLSLSEKDKKAIAKVDWLYITSLSGNWKKILSQALKEVKNVAWNPGALQLRLGAEKLKKFLKQTTVLCLNKDEAIELVLSSKEGKNKSRVFLNNLDNLLKAVYDLGPNIVVITSGREGAKVYNGEKIYSQGIIEEKKLADTTGVGDAFNSAFIAGLEIYNQDISKALLLAAKNASSVISKPGAQNGLLTRKNL
ncbi:MAG: hypothetical protein K9M44_00460 [Candidatus Pacebacteria bacterium]|nr:hypothetical protein [Candidatus Paceibacterota bacterium]